MKQSTFVCALICSAIVMGHEHCALASLCADRNETFEIVRHPISGTIKKTIPVGDRFACKLVDEFFDGASVALPIDNPTNPKPQWITNWTKTSKSFDLEGKKNQVVRCAAAGKVLYSGYYGGYGKSVIIKHAEGGLTTTYAYLAKSFVQTGDRLSMNHVIGLVGSRGYTNRTALGLFVRELPEGSEDDRAKKTSGEQ